MITPFLYLNQARRSTRSSRGRTIVALDPPLIAVRPKKTADAHVNYGYSIFEFIKVFEAATKVAPCVKLLSLNFPTDYNVDVLQRYLSEKGVAVIDKEGLSCVAILEPPNDGELLTHRFVSDMFNLLNDTNIGLVAVRNHVGVLHNKAFILKHLVVLLCDCIFI